MSYKLFYMPNTASLSVHWMLVELESVGVKHELHLVDFEKKDQSSAAYLSLNPKGRVPTLLIDEVPYTEQAALVLILSERHSEARLAPALRTPTRAKFLETMTYLSNSLLPALRDWVYAAVDGSPERAESVRALARQRIEQSWDLLDRQLEGHTYLVGDEVSIADLLACATVSWTKWIERTALARKNVARWVARMKARESWKQVTARETGWVVRAPDFEPKQ